MWLLKCKSAPGDTFALPMPRSAERILNHRQSRGLAMRFSGVSLLQQPSLREKATGLSDSGVSKLYLYHQLHRLWFSVWPWYRSVPATPPLPAIKVVLYLQEQGRATTDPRTKHHQDTFTPLQRLFPMLDQRRALSQSCIVVKLYNLCNVVLRDCRKGCLASEWVTCRRHPECRKYLTQERLWYDGAEIVGQGRIRVVLYAG